MITIQNQNFGVEIELTGITRQEAAQVIADYYGTIGTRFMGTVYKTYEAVDNKGRRWKCMRDASITPQRRVNGHVVDANDEYKCEVVTPILQYEDIPDLQAIVRALVKKGARGLPPYSMLHSVSVTVFMSNGSGSLAVVCCGVWLPSASSAASPVVVSAAVAGTSLYWRGGMSIWAT